MPTKPWHDINEPGVSFEKKDEKPAKEPVGGVDEAGAPPTKQRPAAEYRIISVRAIEPVSGFRRNKPFDIEGEIEPLVEKITRPRIVLYPVGVGGVGPVELPRTA